ncbi:MAG TPA: rod shape-determining protein MreD [Verrucomicrobiota bacterium]|nr:hypothetical protein [Verrucomicrobiales bacterium]HRI12664.1 rod shape-determining protein MreD [Verrucomicrobiota bacterium]
MISQTPHRSRIPTIGLFLLAWLAVFAQTQFAPVANGLGTPLNLLPALMVYAALSNHLTTVAALAVLAGLGIDALSANPLGISVLPLFIVGFVFHGRQHLILRDQAYAQFWLGLAAAIAVPLLTFVLLRMTSAQPIAGPFLVWQLAVTGLLNGALCPALFWLLDTLRRTFDYTPVSEGSFRPDREIKRGRL